MKFKLDENVTGDAMASDFSVSTVRLQGMGGWPDHEIRTACHDEGRVLITADLDLSGAGDLAPDSPGIVVLRLPFQSRPRQIEAVRQLARALVAGLDIHGKLAIVEPSRVRLRTGSA